MTYVYGDASALVKLWLGGEPHAGELARAVAGSRSLLVASRLARTEVLRALRREGVAESVYEDAASKLDEIAFLPCPDDLFDEAASSADRSLRAADAIHLVTARRLGPGLERMLVYDRRLASAARAAGIATSAPGAPGAPGAESAE